MDTSVTIRLSKETKEKLEKLAKEDDRSLSNFIRRHLEKIAEEA